MASSNISLSFSQIHLTFLRQPRGRNINEWHLQFASQSIGNGCLTTSEEPYKSTPLGGSTPVEEYISGCKIGSPMISNNWVVTLSTPLKTINLYWESSSRFSLLLFQLSFARSFAFLLFPLSSSVVSACWPSSLFTPSDSPSIFS